MVHKSIGAYHSVNRLAYCAVSGSKGREEQVMFVENSVVIDRPIEEVFEVATCLRRAVVWRNALISSVQTSAGPVGVGTTFEQELRFMGKSRRNTAVITAYEPPCLFVYQHVEGLSDYEARFFFEAAGGRTRFTVRLGGDPPTFWTKVVPETFQLRWARALIVQEMNVLRDMLETGFDFEAALERP